METVFGPPEFFIPEYPFITFHQLIHATDVLDDFEKQFDSEPRNVHHAARGVKKGAQGARDNSDVTHARSSRAARGGVDIYTEFARAAKGGSNVEYALFLRDTGILYPVIPPLHSWNRHTLRQVFGAAEDVVVGVHTVVERVEEHEGRGERERQREAQERIDVEMEMTLSCHLISHINLVRRNTVRMGRTKAEKGVVSE